jgi:outer membrane immunogenic protein
MVFYRQFYFSLGETVMKKSLFAIALTAGFAANSAFAADLPSRAPPPVYVPPPPIFTWTGFYIGGQLGYEWGRSTNTAALTAGGGPVVGAGEVDPNGVTGGLHLGYNWQVNQFVLGLEGDVNGSSYHGNTTIAGVLTESARTDIDGSVRGRIGWAWDRVLIYGTGGAAFGPQHHVFGVTIPGVAVTDSNSPTRVGWTAGGGLEYALDNYWSVRAEYRYTDFGHSTLVLNNLTGGILSIRSRDTDNRVQAGFSYKFNPPPPPPPPIVAKY